jgi:hypothetical protein
MIAPALEWAALMMPMIKATKATNTKPRRNIVAVIRTVRPRSGAYLVCVAITHLRSSQARDLSDASLRARLSLAIYPNNVVGSLKRSAALAERPHGGSAYGEETLPACPPVTAKGGPDGCIGPAPRANGFSGGNESLTTL